MGWNIPQEKTVEVRKDFPTDREWNKTAHIYCSQNRKSFNRIPTQYKPFMEKLLGKVIGKFVCDSIRKGKADNTAQAYCHNNPNETCLTDVELVLYAKHGKPLYFWHISNLEIYGKPKELYDYLNYKKHQKCLKLNCFGAECERCTKNAIIVFPPQSWYYVEE